MSIQRLLQSRTTVTSLITLLTGAVLISALVPQRIVIPAEEIQAWRRSHDVLEPVADLLGLHHVYTTPWFALLVSLALLSLLFSCLRQVKLAWRATFQTTAVGHESALVATAEASLDSTLKKRGYLRMPAVGVQRRYVKHPWGYWGNALLHVGMVVTIGASLWIALTEQRAVVSLSVGEVCPPGGPWQAEEHGMLAKVLGLPVSVSLDHLRLTFTPDNHVDQAASDLSFIDADGTSEQRTVGINDVLSWRNYTVYQRSDYGDIFSVEFSDDKGDRRVEALPIQYPQTLETASYRNFAFDWLPYGLSAKYYADVARTSMAGPDRQLVLRLLDRDGKEMGRLSLKRGEEGQLGSYTVRLLDIGRWSGFTFVRLSGMAVVFAGFFVIVLGVVLNYFFPPRELIARPADEGQLISWRAVRFPVFFREERDDILAALKETGDPR